MVRYTTGRTVLCGHTKRVHSATVVGCVQLWPCLCGVATPMARSLSLSLSLHGTSMQQEFKHLQFMSLLQIVFPTETKMTLN